MKKFTTILILIILAFSTILFAQKRHRKTEPVFQPKSNEETMAEIRNRWEEMSEDSKVNLIQKMITNFKKKKNANNINGDELLYLDTLQSYSESLLNDINNADKFEKLWMLSKKYNNVKRQKKNVKKKVRIKNNIKTINKPNGTEEVLEVRPQASNLWTGDVWKSIIATYGRDDGAIEIGENWVYTECRGWAVFDISNLPYNAIIDGVSITAYTNTASNDAEHTVIIKSMTLDPRYESDDANLYDDIGNGYKLNVGTWQPMVPGSENHYHSVDFNANGINYLQENTIYYTWCVGFQEEGGDDNPGVFDGWNDFPYDPEPICTITYHLPPELTVSPDNIHFSSNGGTQTVNVSSNTGWHVASSDWIGVNPSSGTGNASVSITVGANTSTTERSGTVIFETNDQSLSVSVSVTQDGQTPTLSVSPSSLHFTSESGTQSVSVTSNTTWNVTSKPGWVSSVNPSSYNGNCPNVNITVTSNNTTSTRSGNIIFKTTDGSVTAYLSISQDGLRQFTINTSSNPPNGGTTSGGGTYNEGTTATVNASANSGFRFHNWTENGNEVSNQASYTFQVMSNRNLTANFELTIPIAPSNLTAHLITWNNSNVIKLQWQDNSNNEDGFKLERKRNGSWEIVNNNISQNSTSYDDYNINEPYSQYQEYRISSYNSAGYSSPTYSGTIVSVNEEESKPTKFMLSQNYPNPFNPTTNIKYSVPTNSFIQICVYDSRGTLVDVLVEQRKVPGYYSVTFDASKLSSGIYFYTLRAGNFVQTKKMLLLK